MLNPGQVKRWREALLTQQGLNQFEGHQVRSITVKPHGATQALREYEREIGHFSPPAKIIGHPVNANCLAGVTLARDVQLEPIRMERVEAAAVIGFASVLGADDTLYNPDLVNTSTITRALEKNKANHDGFIMESGPDGARIHFVSRRNPRAFELDAVFLPALEPGNYGSFVFRQLPLLLHLKTIMPKFDCYIVGDRTPWLLEALSLLGLPQKPIFAVREVCGDRFRSIQICFGADGEAFLNRSTLSGIAELVREVSKTCERSVDAENIYVSRSLSPVWRPLYRPMFNEVEIEEILKKDGFQIIYPETLTFRNQIKIFANAKRIFGPSGSGMLNAVFAVAETKVVDIETFTVAVRQHANLYSCSSKEYCFIFEHPDERDDRPLFQRRWRLQDNLLREALEWAM